nr:unnamed protein product [Callosobruchus chinensis]
MERYCMAEKHHKVAYYSERCSQS